MEEPGKQYRFVMKIWCGDEAREIITGEWFDSIDKCKDEVEKYRVEYCCNRAVDYEMCDKEEEPKDRKLFWRSE